MSFVDIATLRAYTDSIVKANGANSITGTELNTILNGVIDFLGTEGISDTGTFSQAIAAGMASGSVLNIITSLDYTPSIVLVSQMDAYSSSMFFPQRYFLTTTSTGATLTTNATVPMAGTLNLKWVAFK